MGNDTRSRAIDQVCTFLKNEMGDRAPPRSTVEAALGVYDDQRRASSPPMDEAPRDRIITIIAATKLTFTLPGSGAGEIALGTHAALDILVRLGHEGVKLMVAKAR